MVIFSEKSDFFKSPHWNWYYMHHTSYTIFGFFSHSLVLNFVMIPRLLHFLDHAQYCMLVGTTENPCWQFRLCQESQYLFFEMFSLLSTFENPVDRVYCLHCVTSVINASFSKLLCKGLNSSGREKCNFWRKEIRIFRTTSCTKLSRLLQIGKA